MARMEAQVLRMQINGPTQERNDFFVATRETAELRAETLQMGRSLALLLRDLELADMDREECSFPMAFALAVKCLGVGPHDALVAAPILRLGAGDAARPRR